MKRTGGTGEIGEIKEWENDLNIDETVITMTPNLDVEKSHSFKR